jgi:hypothetical protein
MADHAKKTRMLRAFSTLLQSRLKKMDFSSLSVVLRNLSSGSRRGSCPALHHTYSSSSQVLARWNVRKSIEQGLHCNAAIFLFKHSSPHRVVVRAHENLLLNRSAYLDLR